MAIPASSQPQQFAEYDCLTAQFINKMIGDGSIENVERATDFIARNTPEAISKRQDRGEEALNLSKPEEELLVQMTKKPTRREMLVFMGTKASMAVMVGGALTRCGTPLAKEYIKDRLRDPAGNLANEERQSLENCAKVIPVLEKNAFPAFNVGTAGLVASALFYCLARQESVREGIYPHVDPAIANADSLTQAFMEMVNPLLCEHTAKLRLASERGEPVSR